MCAVVVGVGARPGIEAAAVVAAVRTVVGDRVIHCLATVDRRADEPGLVAAAAELGVPIVSFAAAELVRVEVPNPARRTAAALGTPGVAEAAALLACRRWRGSAALTLPKTGFTTVTVAVAEPG